MLKKHLQQVYALFNIVLMLFQTVAPAAFLVTPAYAATEAQEVAVSGVALSFDKDSNEFTLSGTATEAVEYVVSYRGSDPEIPEEAVMGSAQVTDGTFSETIYAGTCSGADCVADEVVSGTVVLSNANYKAEYEITDGVLWLRSGAVATVAQLELGTKYVAPQNDDVTVTFTKLPENPGTLSIEEITLTDEQVAELGALSNVAYDITSSMEDGTFEYELTLPRPEGSDETVTVKHAETVEELASAEKVETVEVTDKVTAKGLDHFTVFVVTSFEEEQTTPPTDGYNDIWFAYGATGAEVERVASGTNGINSSEGSYHAVLNDGAFTRWNGYSDTFPSGGYDTRVDVYLDMSAADGSDKRFDFSSAINTPAGGHRRDFIIHLGTNPSVAGQWLASASNNAPGWPGNPDRNPVDITETGWYTIEHSFRNVGGVLEVTISLYKKGETTPVGSWVLSTPADIIGDTVGGNRYGWFIWNMSPSDTLPIDAAVIEEHEATVTTIIIPEENISWMFNRDTSTASPYEFNTGAASIGSGSLYAQPISSNPSDKFIAENFMYTPIADVANMSYDFKIGAGGEAADAAHFYMNVYANFGESDPDKYYDCRYDIVPTVGSTGDFTTVTFDMHQAQTVTTRNSSPYTCPAVPANMETLSEGSSIRAIALNVGDTSANDEGLDGYLDNFVVNKGAEVTIYDFEPDTAPATPTGIRILDHEGNDLACGGYTTNRRITVDWDDNTESDFDHYDYRIREGSVIAHPTVSKYTGNIRDEDGVYKYSVRAVDAAGNASEWSPWCEVTLDREAPAAPEIVFPNENDGFKTTPILNDWTDVTDASGIMKYRVQYEYDDGHTFSGYPYRETTASQRNHVPNTSEEGGVMFRVQAFDNAGNEGAWSEWRHYYYDLSAPSTPEVLGFLSPDLQCGAVTNIHSTTVDWTDAVDAGAGFDHYEYNIDYPKPNGTRGVWSTNLTQSQYSGSLNEGAHHIKVRAVDVLGNTSEWSNTCTITTDWSVGVPTITAPTEGEYFNVNTIRAEWTEVTDPSGMDKYEIKYEYLVNGVPTVAYREVPASRLYRDQGLSGNVQGDFTIQVRAYDALGNVGAWSDAVTYTYDTVNPSSIITTFDLPDGGEVETATFSGLIEGTATDATSGVAEVNLEIMYTPFGSTDSVYWNGTDWQSAATMVTAVGTDTWSYQIPEAFVAEGIYDVTSHATDMAGNVETTYTIKIVYDKTIPEVVLTIDPTTPDGNNGWYKLYEPQITLTASDNYDVDYIEYQWNTTTDGNWKTYTGPIKPPSQGQNILYYRAVDLVGNVSSPGVKDVRYDNTDPADYPLNVRVENITADDADGVWERPKDDSDVTRYVLEWKHEDGTVRGATVGRDTFKHKLDQLKDGVWEFSVKAMDDAGNFKESKVSFRVGPEPATGTETVLGVTDTIEGDGIGGAILGARSNGSSQEDEKAADEGSEKSGSEEAVEEGEVLGATSCSSWKYYLPLILIALQLLSILAFEFFRRTPGLFKLGVVAAITVGVVALFYFFKDAGCYVDGSWLAMITQWFPGLSLVTAVVTKLLAYGFIEEA